MCSSDLTYHPYTFPSSADSQTLNISTPSSTMLLSSCSADSQWKIKPSCLCFCCLVFTVSTTLSLSLKSLPRTLVQHTDLFGETCKLMKHAPSFSVTAKGSDVSSNEEEHLCMKQTKKAHHSEHFSNKMLSSCHRWTALYNACVAMTTPLFLTFLVASCIFTVCSHSFKCTDPCSRCSSTTPYPLSLHPLYAVHALPYALYPPVCCALYQFQ